MALTRLREVADRKGMSRNKLSRIADVSLPVVREMFRDPDYDVKLSTLRKLAAALGVSICELIVEQEDHSHSPQEQDNFDQVE